MTRPLGAILRLRAGYRTICVLVAWACFANLCRAADSPVTCVICHKQQADEFARSVHTALHCQDCHQGRDTYPLSPAEVQSTLQLARGPEVSFDHGPSFVGTPPRADIPELCGTCHANVERMNPYGLRTDQLSRYWTSRHGKRLKKEGDDRVAVCVDCHGSHEIRPGHEAGAKTHPFNVPDTCGACHLDAELMGEYGLPVEVVDEYRQSVHGRLLFEQQDTGAPTCVTCHGNHSAAPPGYAAVGAVCGQCHDHVTKHFETSIHARQSEHKGCVQCHGGGEGRHFHLIERITKLPGVMIRRYARLLASGTAPSAVQVTEAIHPDPKKIVTRVLPTCLECHEELDEDESLPKLFELLDEIAAAERYYVRTANRLNQVGKGVLLVDNQRFLFEDAKTHLIGLAPLQHTLDNSLVAERVAELRAVCDQVNAELTTLEEGLHWRHRALAPIWGFAVLLAAAFYAKYKRLRVKYVKRPWPPPTESKSV